MSDISAYILPVLTEAPMPLTKADEVEERIIEYLKTENFQAGDIIPKESQLALVLGVSRPVIREAMSRLRMFGIIESKKRRGAVLRHLNLISAIERVLLPHMLSKEAMQDIFELRLVLEIGIADLLFLRKTEEDLFILEHIVEGEGELLSKTRTPDVIENLLACDLAFHSKLYQIAGNQMIQSFQRVLIPTIKHVIENQFKMDSLSYGRITHAKLIEILKKGDPEKYRLAMRGHLELHFDKIK